MVVEKLGGNEQTTTKVEYPIVLRRNHMQFNQYQQLAERTANIGEKLFLERAQVYRRKDKALNHLALLLYGK
jgi:UDP-galactopyranose mutase